MSNTEGRYIYGIIAAGERRAFGPIGIGDRGEVVYTLPFQNLAAIVSSSPVIKYPVTKDNSLAHARVLEKALEEYTVLPVRFCTIAEKEEIIVERVLKARYHELMDLLHGMEGKVELGVRVRWTNMDAIFAEIVAEHTEIKAAKEALSREKNQQKQYAGSIKVGQLVQKALEEKKKREVGELLDTLRPLSLASKENLTYGDMNLVNAAFLIERAREDEFDRKVQELDALYGERKKIKYVGPMAPYNFVEIVVNF